MSEIHLKTWAILFVALMAAAGCQTQPGPDVATHYDNFTGLRTDVMADNLLEAGDQPRELLWLNASRIFRSRNQYSFYLEVTYMAREDVGLIDIQPGDSLSLIIDGEKHVLSGSGSLESRQEKKDQLVQEGAIFKTDKLTLQRIAIATKVTVMVKGKNGLIEREFNEKNFERFRQFVTRYGL